MRVRIWARNILLGLIAFAFIVLFGNPAGGPTVPPVAEVDGEPITRDLFEFFRAQNEELVRETLGNLDPQTLQNMLDSQTLGALVRRALVSEQATELGLWVSEPEIHAEIVSSEGFQRAGRFDREIFERFVVRAGLESPRVYIAEVRKDLLMQKFQRAVASPVRVSRAAAEEAARREGTRVRVRLAVARPDAFLDRVELTEEEVATFVDENGAEIETLYQERVDEFVRPEEVQARHMLFTGEDASERAQAASKRIREGEDFATLAYELSEDAATKEEGGALGLFPRGRMLPPFEEAAFSLSPGEVSDPVETERGVHLILVEEHREGSERSLDELASELGRELLSQERAAGVARQAAETMAARIGSGADFETAAADLGLALETPPAFGWAQAGIPGLEGVTDLKAAALTLDSAHQAVPRVFELPRGFGLVSLVEREEPTPEQIEGVIEQTRERLAQELRTRVMGRWFEERRQELQDQNLILFYPLYPTG
jgi:peptidyl-prolyl cis-trans isomerase D